MGKPRFSVGKIAPSKELVDQYFNDSTGQGDMGEVDTKGPWNEGEAWEVVDAPAFKEARGMSGEAEIKSEASQATAPEAIRELLIEQMRDLLHAEKQLVKALPKMAKAAKSEQLVTLIEHHLTETETQVERLTEGLKMLDAPVRAKPCKGMMGLLAEGDEVMSEAKRMEPAGADLALIGAAQKVEHYEIAGYITARNLAQQLKMADLVQLLQLSLAEEENADQLLNQLARPLMSAARMPEPVA
jgi:Mn-containing catalase